MRFLISYQDWLRVNRQKNYIIAGLAIICLALAGLAYYNSVPRCDDLVRYPYDQSHQLVCELGLGNIPEDQAKVRINSR